MASIQATLSGSPSVIPLDAPTGRIVVTMMSSPAEAWFTVDGSLPVAPSGTENPTTQKTLAGVTGAQIVLQPPFYGDHMVIPTIRAASSGSPVVEIEW
jgi:hypothetical protein